jgi:hypothetical protein
MNKIFETLTPAGFPDLFTLLWAGSLLIVVGTILVYVWANRRYRRYPSILALHEWTFWSLIIPWALTPLLVVIHVPLLLVLLVVLPGMGVALWAAFIKFPPIIAAANDEIRRQRFVPPPRRELRDRPRPTPAGRRRKHR